MKLSKLMTAMAVLLLGAVVAQSELVKPDGLVVLKNWNFDGDGAVGGAVDSGTSGTDWVNNSADSVLSEFTGDIYGSAWDPANPDRNSNLYVDTSTGTLNYQSPAINDPSRFRIDFDEAKSAGWLDMRAKAELLEGSGVFSAQVRFLGATGNVLAEINMRKNNDLRFTIGADNYTFDGETVNAFNGYQVAWLDGKISMFFDDEANGGVNAQAYTDLAIDGDVAGIQWTVTTSGSTGKGTIDSLNLEVIPEPATIGLFGVALGGLLMLRRFRR